MSKRRRATLRLCWLETFLSVVDHDCVDTYAARALDLHPSQVGDDLTDLSLWLRGTLFEGTYPKTLTPLGFSFVGVAREIVDTLHAARRERQEQRSTPVEPKNLRVKPNPDAIRS